MATILNPGAKVYQSGHYDALEPIHRLVSLEEQSSGTRRFVPKNVPKEGFIIGLPREIVPKGAVSRSQICWVCSLAFRFNW